MTMTRIHHRTISPVMRVLSAGLDCEARLADRQRRCLEMWYALGHKRKFSFLPVAELITEAHVNQADWTKFFHKRQMDAGAKARICAVIEERYARQFGKGAA